jgi:DNA processing protein
MRSLPLTHDEIAAWLTLAHAGGGLGAAALHALLAAFGTPQAVLAQPDEVLACAAGRHAAAAVRRARAQRPEAQLAALEDWLRVPSHHFLTLADPAYPPLLLTLPDPPTVLYAWGDLACLAADMVAIVGARHATAQGLVHARHFATALANAGLVIVSGLATGIDAAAHRGALQAGGATVAVVGTGADRTYPSHHRALADDIALAGAVLSEWPLGTPPRAAHFPQRNRLIAALSRGVLVVEAAPRSGSLITARVAAEIGREVFAVPGSIHAPLSRGCHRLIRDGAKLVEATADILEELPRDALARAAARASGGTRPEQAPKTGTGIAHGLPQAGLSGEAARALRALGHDPATFDALVARARLDGATLQGALLELELAGRLSRLPGGRYVRLDDPGAACMGRDRDSGETGGAPGATNRAG